MPGTLYVVATPIGNLDDISARAVDTLRRCHLVVAEDTRHSGRLLKHLGVDTPMRSLHEHSSEKAVVEMCKRLESGDDLALISDAGTPLISDPGFELVRLARENGITVLTVPGPCAAIAGLSVSGLATDRFSFCGFPPSKSGQRQAWLEALADRSETLVFYESCHRVVDFLADLVTVLGPDRKALVAREMTKLHEQHGYGSLSDLAGRLAGGDMPSRGEFVVAVSGAPESKSLSGSEREARRLLKLLLAELPPSRAAKLVAAATGLPKNACYQLAEDLKSSPE
jgi:16S rRNA (cytidine1402-2'-O)-methyltransferase